jgi:hypothetical protein
MTQPTDRELLQEIHQAWVMASDTGGVIHHLSGPMSRVAAALAQPEPEERPIWTEGVCGDGAAILKDGVMQPIESVIAALNAAELAQPEPEGLPDAEALMAAWDSAISKPRMGRLAEYRTWLAHALSLVWAVDRVQTELRPTIEPVPVAERLPGPEDCDAENRCWWFCPAAILPSGQCAYWCLAPADGSRSWFTHWLPHHAMPIPTTH